MTPTKGMRIVMLKVHWNKYAEGEIGTIADSAPLNPADLRNNIPARWYVNLDRPIKVPHRPHETPHLTKLLVGENEMLPILDINTLETIW